MDVYEAADQLRKGRNEGHEDPADEGPQEVCHGRGTCCCQRCDPPAARTTNENGTVPSRHWRTCWDEDGEPYGELCDCPIGDDHDENRAPNAAE